MLKEAQAIGRVLTELFSDLISEVIRSGQQIQVMALPTSHKSWEFALYRNRGADMATPV